MGNNVVKRPQQVRWVPDKIIDYSPNNRVSKNLGLGVIYRSIMVQLNGQITLAGASNTQSALAQGDEWACVKNIRLIANNTEVLLDISGNDLYWLNFFQFGTPPKITMTLGDGLTTNPSFNSSLMIPLWTPNSRRPIDTALDASRLSSLKLEITWGNETSINSAATGWTKNPTISMFCLTSFGVVMKFSMKKTSKITVPITADNTKLQVPLTVGALYRSFMVNTTDNDADSDQIINNIRVQAGSTVYFDWPSEVLKKYTDLIQGCEHFHDGQAVSKYFPIRRGDANNFNAWYYLDLASDGMMSECPDTTGFSEFNLYFDVNKGVGTTLLNVIPTEIYPPRG